MIMRRFLFTLTLLLAAPAGLARDVDRADRAVWAVAEVLLAGDLAKACPHMVRTLDGKDANALLSAAIVTFINERGLTMADFAAASQLYSAADIRRIKGWLLKRDRVDAASSRSRCFYGRRIAGTAHAVGRFLEPR